MFPIKNIYMHFSFPLPCLLKGKTLVVPSTVKEFSFSYWEFKSAPEKKWSRAHTLLGFPFSSNYSNLLERDHSSDIYQWIFLNYFFSSFFFLFNLYKDVSCLFTEEPMGGDLSWWWALVRDKHVILKSSIKLQWIRLFLKSAFLSVLIVSCTFMP